MSSRTQPRRNRGALAADRIFNSTSPITNADIQTFLSLCIASWPSYSEEERRSIISTLPPWYREFAIDAQGSLICPLTPDSILQDRILRDNIARFQREVSDGYYTKTWQEKAKKASQERVEGKYDDYLRSHAEEMFGDTGEADRADDMEEESDGEYGGRKGKGGTKNRGAKLGKMMMKETSTNRISTAANAGYDDPA